MTQHLEHSMPIISSQNLYKAGDEITEVVGKGRRMGPRVTEMRDEIQQSYQELGRRRGYAQATWRLLLMIGDGVVLFSLFILVFVLMPYSHLALGVSRVNPATWDTKLLWSVFALLSWSVAARITQAYGSLNASDRFASILKALSALTLALIFWAVLTSRFFSGDFTTFFKVVSLFFVLAIPVLSAWRVLFAEILNLPRFRRKAVIVGTTPAGKIIAKDLLRAKRPYATILGYISENTDERFQQNEVPVLGGRSTLRRLGRSGMIDMIITAVDYNEYPGLFQEVIEMAQSGVSVVPMAIAYENTSGKIPVEYIGDQWYLALPLEVAVSPLYVFWRKCIDVSFGLFGTVVLLLILPILALLIYLDSPGPIFYRQERIGLRGKPFRVYKFRSMRTDAEQTGHAIWATDNDPRITSIGRFMRMTHLDELAQALNILRGDMSLIGPRPEREEFTTQLEKTIPFYRCRLMVKPGLTGWAQVKYHYGSTDNDALIKLQYDLHYIKHQSFIHDIFILLKTVIEVFLHRGT